MADQGDGREGAPPAPPSFDPHTWLGPKDAGAASSDPHKVAPPASATPATPSFDPKTWIAPAKPAARPPSVRQAPSRRGVILAGAGAATAAAAGGAWLLLHGGRPRRATTDARISPVLNPGSDGVAPPAASAGGGLGSRVMFDADSLQHLKVQLRYGYGVSDAEAQSVTAALAEARGGEHGALHIVMQMGSAGADQIAWLTARGSDGVGVRLDRVDDTFMATAVSSALTARLCATRTGVMNDQSFYTSATSVLHDDVLTAQFVAAMSYDFNFAHEVPPGSTFRAVYEERRDRDGNLIGPRQLRMAFLEARAIDDEVEFQGVKRARHAPTKARTLFLFDADRDGRAAWYDTAGASAVRGLMRTPVEAARVTSKFGPRMHPIFETVKIHEGVDFGCPIGTPVFAAAEGVVAIAGPVHGYGNYLRIAHGPHMWTAYGHLSAYAATTVPGAKVSQGQVVAFTGNTGNSTGPHLHYEIRIDGVAVDPLTFETTQTRALTGAQLQAFARERDRFNEVRDQCA